MTYSRQTRFIIKKLTASLLALLFTISPLGTALAQDVPPIKQVSSAASSTQSVPSASPSPVTPPPAAEEEGGDTPPPPETLLVDEIVPQIPDPVTGSVFNQDLLKISKNTGALNLTYPITIPPGRNGLQPDVDLIYGSQDSRLENIFGRGWSIEIPYIERLNKSGVNNLYATSAPRYFTSSLDGELATTTESTTYIARTDNGTFNEYTFENNQWVMTDKNGTQYTFGTSTNSRVHDLNNSANVHRWMLGEVRDTNDNYVSYSYYKDSGQVYPSTIVYTGNGTTDGIFSVDFLRESRSDNRATSSRTGFGVKTNYRISEIEVSVGESLVREYALDYTTGDNGTTSLLSSIIESGYDSLGGTTTLPAATFSYQEQTPGWAAATSSWASPEIFAHETLWQDVGTRIADVNSDGLPDILNAYYDGVHSSTTYLNNGDGTWTTYTYPWTSPVQFAREDSRQDVGTRIVDVNGDGFPDILQAYDFPSVSSTAYLNNGDGTWTESTTTWASPVIFAMEGVRQDVGTRIADINGDGLSDILQAHDSSFNPITYLNDGDGTWTESTTTWVSPVPFARQSSDRQDHGTRIADINGDGLVDILKAYGFPSFSSTAYLNNGDGTFTEATTTWASPLEFAQESNRQDFGMRILDVNEDGFADILNAYSAPAGFTTFAWLSHGDGVWTISSTTWVSPEPFANQSVDRTDAGTRGVDINGDGLTDILRATNNVASIAYLNNNETRADLLIGVAYSQGGSTTIEYTTAALSASNSIPYPVYLVSEITHNDGSDDVSSTTFEYTGGTYYFNNSFDRQLAGFSQVSETDSEGNVTETFYHTANDSDVAHGEYNDNFWKIGKPYRVEQYDNAGNLYKKTINKWDSHNRVGNAGFVKMVQSVEADYDGVATHKDAAFSYTYDNNTGNLSQEIEWGLATSSDDGTFTDSGSDKYTTDFSYATGTNISKTSTTTVKDQSSNKIKETRLYYDGLSIGSTTLGNLTRQEGWKSGSSYINIQNTYNGYGLVTQRLDPRGKQTTYVYDAHNLYPATTTNPAGHVTQAFYDYSSGKPTQTTDPNGSIFQTVYDGLDRVTQVKQPDPVATTTLVTKTAYIYTDTPNAVSVHQTDYLTSTTTVETYTYFDGLKRKIQTRRSAEEGNYVATDVVYNNRGLIQKESLPYFSSGSSKTTATSTPSLYVNYTYDALKRASTTANAVGTTTHLYRNWKTTITDTMGKVKDIYDDADDNLIQVNELNGASTYSTYYIYNGLRNLTRITDAHGNVRNFTYDGLGRRLTAEDLHASGDGTYGTWTYVYDEAGNLATTTDPKSQVVEHTYDAISRALTENYTGQAGTDITYTYDSCLNGKGRLCSATTSEVGTSYTYYPTGEQKIVVKSPNLAIFYVTSYDYDRQGNVATTTLPDNSKIRYAYNTAGLVESVSHRTPQGVESTLVSDFDYAPTGQVTYQVFANGLATTREYDSEELYRLRHLITEMGGMGGADEGLIGEGDFAIELAEELAEVLSNDEGLELEVATDTIAANDELTALAENVTDTVTTTEETADATSSELDTAVEPAPAEVPAAEEPTVVAEDFVNLTVASSSLAEEYEDNEAIKGEYILSGAALVKTKEDIGIIVGDIDGSSFKPQATLTRWDEVSLNISVPSTGDLSGSVSFEDDKIVWSEGGRKARFYELPATDDLPEAGYEIDVVLDRKPASNVIEFNISAENLEFFYQAPLNQELHDEDVERCTATQCCDAANNIVRERPENVIGSYAVYYKDGILGDYSLLGGKNYRVGKAFHIYRPKIMDAAGNTTWGELNVDLLTNTLSVTVPQEFLDAAVYPVVVDPTFGHTGVGASSATSVSYFIAARANAIGHGNLSSISFYGSGDTSGNQNQFAIYSSASGVPSNRVDYTVTGNLPSTAGWTTFETVNDASIASSTYHLSYHKDNGGSNVTYYFDTTSGYTRYWNTVFQAFNPPPTSPLINGTTTNSRPSIYATYASSSVPTAPTSLLTESLTNPAEVTDSTPEFSAIYIDSDTGDVANKYRIQVSTSSSFASIHWDSGTTSMASTSQGARSPDIAYGGSALASSTTYYWRIKFWDAGGREGDWSTETATFSLAAALLCNNAVQNIWFTYDAAGNITELYDCSTSGTGKTIIFGYDDLHRLTSASTTAASSTPFIRTYSHTPLGNIATSSDLGNYLYAGTGYANPHAATSIGNGVSTTSYTYDNNGNLLTAGSWAYLWNYKNRLIRATTSTLTTASVYDHEGARVALYENSATTTFVNEMYSLRSATTTKHIFANGMLIATIEGNGTATSTHYVHPDHLNGTNVMTNGAGGVVQAIDYYPYGSRRINSGSDVSQREFIGEMYDESGGLNYLNARYYQSSRGQFLSQDPSFLAVGHSEFEGRYRRTLPEHLANPQAINSYGYGLGNPLVNKDPGGEIVWAAPIVGGVIGGIGGFTAQAISDIQTYQVNKQHNPAAAFTFSSPKEYAASVVTGAMSGAVGATFGVVAAAGAVGLGSIGTDVYLGNPVSVTDAGIDAAITLLTGGFVRFGAGANPLDVASRATSEIVKQGIQYGVTQEVFQTAVGGIVEREQYENMVQQQKNED